MNMFFIVALIIISALSIQYGVLFVYKLICLNNHLKEENQKLREMALMNIKIDLSDIVDTTMQNIQNHQDRIDWCGFILQKNFYSYNMENNFKKMKNTLPKRFLERLEMIHGDDYEKILKNFSKKRIGSFRINMLKSSLEEVKEEFDEKKIIFKKFGNYENIFIFDRDFEYAIKWTRAFYDGKIYLQSIASMLPVLALNVQKWEKILDVCAAPGSKTTQIAMMQENFWKIFALEKNQIRADKLAYNCRLQGAENVEIFKTDAKKFLENSSEIFDKILLDAPCSAEGRIDANNEKSFGFWSEKNILEKANLQKGLLQNAWKNLKKWGTLVYSTCTLAPEENEMLVSEFLKKFADAKIEKIEIWMENEDFYRENISEFMGKNFENLEKKWVRILPTEFTEGFFVAKIVKG